MLYRYHHNIVIINYLGHDNQILWRLCLNEFSPSKINVSGISLQGANILLTDKGDVKLGKLLFSVLILDRSSSVAFGRMWMTSSEKPCQSSLQLTLESQPK